MELAVVHHVSAQAEEAAEVDVRILALALSLSG